MKDFEQPELPGMEVDEEDPRALREEANREFKQNGRSKKYEELINKWSAAKTRRNRNEILSFDPNRDEDNLPKYATYCPTRSNVDFKMHSKMSYAVRAAKMHDGAIYRWDDTLSSWVFVEAYFKKEKIIQ